MLTLKKKVTDTNGIKCTTMISRSQKSGPKRFNWLEETFSLNFATLCGLNVINILIKFSIRYESLRNESLSSLDTFHFRLRNESDFNELESESYSIRKKSLENGIPSMTIHN